MATSSPPHCYIEESLLDLDSYQTFAANLDKHDSHDSLDLPGPRSSSISDSCASSSSASPAPEIITFHGGQLQLRWSVETQELVSDNSNNSDQHYEKSCPKCKLTSAEARKCKVERRRGQNRESQRKYRARKESRLREAASQVAVLEKYVEFLEKNNNDLEDFNAKLQQQINDLDAGEQVCMIYGVTSGVEEIQTKSSESWKSGTLSTDVSKAAAVPNLGWVPDSMHLSLFYHELLPPSHQSSMIADSEMTDYAARL